MIRIIFWSTFLSPEEHGAILAKKDAVCQGGMGNLWHYKVREIEKRAC
jgi:hypothetical protein